MAMLLTATNRSKLLHRTWPSQQSWDVYSRQGQHHFHVKIEYETFYRDKNLAIVASLQFFAIEYYVLIKAISCMVVGGQIIWSSR
jgi:uncharacterized membrane protein YjgN (DUF898 family)